MKITSEIKFLRQPEIREIQEKKLQELLVYTESNSPYYQKNFKRNGIDINRITHLEDLAMLPLTSKDDLQLYNDEFLCVPKSSVIEYTSTSGTLG